jgi:2-aminoethylphosphonate-pyruvate transaminase
MVHSAREPYLLTPGPLTTSITVRRGMLRDWGSRDREFVALSARVRERLVRLAGGAGTHVCVPLQGSGTFAVEAMLGTLVPRAGRLLVLVNGAYGERMVRIARYHGREVVTLETPEDQPNDVAALERVLAADQSITHVAAVHCETTSGMLNPIARIAEITAAAGRRLLIDAMSSFGALPLDARAVPFDAVAASANRCLEGVPGVGFALVRNEAPSAAEGNAPALSLDLYDQWPSMERTGQWRFTPPTHVIAALDQALEEHEAEGGVAGRGMRYRANCRILIEGVRASGSRRCCQMTSRRRSSRPSRCPPTCASRSTISMTGCAIRATRASSRSPRAFASAASGGSAATRCAAHSPRSGPRSPPWA